MNVNRIICGDALEVLKGLPDGLVQCCVTSPPYWGLRDYGIEGQLGLEPTPEEYVAKMVEVSREVRRVLRDDGVLFLNLGDSMMGSGGAHKQHHKNPGLSKSFERSGVQRVTSCGKNGIQLEGCSDDDCLSRSQCDVNPEILGLNRKAHNDIPPSLVLVYGATCPNRVRNQLHCSFFDSLGLEMLKPFERSGHATHDLRQICCPVGGLPLFVHPSTMPEFLRRLQDSYLQKDNSFSCPLISGSTFFDAHRCGHKTVYLYESEKVFDATQGHLENILDTEETACASASHKEDTVSCCFSLCEPPKVQPQYSITDNWSQGLKPKDLVGIPWRVAFALQADGWWLRQDIIWHKPNPMPESVTDRCTKAHEYLFLLTKSAKYYYDADAIKEDPQRNVSVGWKDSDLKKYSCDPRLEKQGSYKDWRKYCPTGNVEKRNKRSVWTIPTAPFPEAHFATFPPKLIEPCILAGSKPGDIVLDPFMGSGTTAIVAHNLGRKWLGIELSPEYCEMARARIARETQQINMNNIIQETRHARA